MRIPVISGSLRAAVRWMAAGTVAAVLAVLALVAIDQDGRIDRLQQQAADARRTATAAADDADRRMNGADDRTKRLEARLASLDERSRLAFDPKSVAASALPSVFQVVAGDYTGSAFAIGRQKAGRTHVLTAFHVIEQVWKRGRTTVRLERDGRAYTAAIADVSPRYDIALLTISAKVTGLTAAAAAPAPGEQILVVGAPLGLTDTITTGVVSAVRARVGAPGTMIQIDAPVNPGNSGGPVINTRKEAVGIADAKAQNSEGIGLAVPIQTACKIFKVC